MLKWSVGDVTITRVLEFELPVAYSEKRPFVVEARPEALREMPWLYDHFVTADGHLMLAVQALLIDAPGLRLIVDTCVGNDKPRRMTGKTALQTNFLELLGAAGCPPESVQAVVCTHLHVDHVGWNTRLQDGKWVPTFPNARYLLGRAEYEHFVGWDDAEKGAILADSIQPIFDAGLVELVEMNHRLSAEVRLIPTPGHTPGHVSVMIESRGQQALITGDVMHHPCQIGRPSWTTLLDGDREAAGSTRRSLLDSVADQPVLLIGTHFATPTAGHVKRDGVGFRFEV
ncbi:MAG TPA: MBL fold metallo-hydrolase [Polyangiales bacterium]|nr:MBL fold metallo-hydrolase [Polyangiales bacterium]